MIFSGLSWLLIGFTIFNINPRVHAIHNVKEVIISRDICGTTLDLHKQESRRLLFQNTSTCRSLFTCRLIFQRSSSTSLFDDICVDYSRLQLRGDRTFLNISQRIHSRLTQKIHLSGKEQNPSKTGKHKSVYCTHFMKAIVLDFSIECNTSLDDAVRSWLYVYAQSLGMDAMYFLDGTCSHQHRLSNSYPLFLQSQFWNDVRSEWKNQTCSIHLIYPRTTSKAKLCISWEQTSSVLPPGVSLNIKKLKSSGKKALVLAKSATSYLSLQEGDRFPRYKNCFSITSKRDFLIEVNRQTDTARDESYPKHGMTLFSVTVKLELPDQKPSLDIFGEPPVFEVDEKSTKTQNDFDEDVLETTVSEMEEDHFSLNPWVLKIGGAIVAMLGIVCCLSAVSSKQNQRSSDSPSAASSRGSLNGQRMINSSGGDLRAAGYPEAQPMVDEIPSAPPALEMDNVRETGLNEPPPPYHSQVQEQPPAYSDLFPTSS